jgi:type I restriction-modification system DNA methylase subunit
VPHLARCRYNDALRAIDYNFGGGTVPLATFSDTPHDSRSICTASFDALTDPAPGVAALRALGAPIVFSCHAGKLQWWKQTTTAPELLANIEAANVKRFFDEHRDDLSPQNVFEGKTLRRLPQRKQLSFVDAGLMPQVERESGEAISALVERVIQGMEKSLGRHVKTDADVNAVYKSTFWLLAAKVLREKRVPNFIMIKLVDIDDVFRRVGLHYGDTNGLPPGGPSWRSAIKEAAQTIESFPRLAHVSVDALDRVYEDTMIPPEVRKAHGIHSTPGALVDYMVWQLWPWIEQLPPDRRHVFEPACGHSAFLVGALRVLRQWSDIGEDQERHDYLRKHLHGIELDTFALEVAKLRLTLADMPHGNKWDLILGDMFDGAHLERESKRCGVLLANPPYERFTQAEQNRYKKRKTSVIAVSKAAEMLRRTIPHLAPGACFGVVVPHGFLNSNESTDLRRKLLSDFEIAEIDVFEDQLFEKADHEAAVLLGRRRPAKATAGEVWFRRVRNSGMEVFRQRFAFSSEQRVDLSRFALPDNADLRVPEGDAVWDRLSKYPRLATVAKVGQGFSFRGEDLPESAGTLSARPKAGYRPCFVTARGDPPIFGAPEKQWMNPDSSVIQRPRMGLVGQPGQVIVNHARASRDAWTMKAWLDQEGIAVKGNFLVVRSKHAEVTGVALWALLNSPVANAFVYCRATKRHIIGGDLLSLPIPNLRGETLAGITSAAQAYLATTRETGGFFRPDPNPSAVREALLSMDAAVLRAYNLPPRLEHQLLSIFWGVERKGVGCDFRGYYPPDARPFVPLHEFISDTFRRATAGKIAARYRPVRSKAAIAAIDAVLALHDGE